MITETIFRLNSMKQSIEMVSMDENNNIIAKQLDPLKFFSKMSDLDEKYNNGTNSTKLTLFEKGIIANNNNYTLVKQEESKRVVSLMLGKEFNYYKINFPNSIYLIKHKNKEKIIKIKCYSYIEYKGEETELYEYPMPNELTDNEMCMGNADRTIKNGKIVEALNRIIYCPYSHLNFSGIYGFSESKKYFEYLEKHPFPYKKMLPLNIKLKDIL